MTAQRFCNANVKNTMKSMILKSLRGLYNVFAMPMPKTKGKYIVINILSRQYNVFTMTMPKTH